MVHASDQAHKLLLTPLLLTEMSKVYRRAYEYSADQCPNHLVLDGTLRYYLDVNVSFVWACIGVLVTLRKVQLQISRGAQYLSATFRDPRDVCIEKGIHTNQTIKG